MQVWSLVTMDWLNWFLDWTLISHIDIELLNSYTLFLASEKLKKFRSDKIKQRSWANTVNSDHAWMLEWKRKMKDWLTTGQFPSVTTGRRYFAWSHKRSSLPGRRPIWEAKSKGLRMSFERWKLPPKISKTPSNPHLRRSRNLRQQHRLAKPRRHLEFTRPRLNWEGPMMKFSVWKMKSQSWMWS